MPNLDGSPPKGFGCGYCGAGLVEEHPTLELSKSCIIYDFNQNEKRNTLTNPPLWCISMTDKWTPHHGLLAIKLAFSNGEGFTTRVAARDAVGLGCSSADIKAIIQTIDRAHFYKSMTSNYDASVWQDVYHVPHASRILYVKFTDNGSVTDFTLLSFKEK
jgi:motility quorum-sensing regulator/GCU-specific mRNA interferase toxin